MSKELICPYAKLCGGCQYQGIPYVNQLNNKQVEVERLLKSFCHVNKIIGMDNPYHYRNKMQFAFGTNKRNEIISGNYQPSTHIIVPINNCLIGDENADAIVETIREMMRSFKLRPFNDVRMQGLIRHVLIKKGFNSGQIMVVIVVGTHVFPSKRTFISELLKKHPEITTIVININSRRTSMVLGDKSEVVYGSGKIEEQLCGFTFRISPTSFYQVNPIQTEVLYKKAITYANLTGQETVIDAYCGTGTIGIIASQHAKKVIGVELNADAINDAKENANLNHIGNIKFVCGDAGDFMVRTAMNKKMVDVVFIDPPRNGCDIKFLDSLAKLAPKKIVYISCNPITLARDLTYMTKKSYTVTDIQPVDMFPFTEHVECLVLMSRVEKEGRRKPSI